MTPDNPNLEQLRAARAKVRAEVSELRKARREAKLEGAAPSPREGLIELEERLRRIELSIKVLATTGQSHGLFVADQHLLGTVCLPVKAQERSDRQKQMFELVSQTLEAQAGELGLTLTANAQRYGKPWDPEPHQWVFEVEAKIEGDYLVPTRNRGPKPRARKR